MIVGLTGIGVIVLCKRLSPLLPGPLFNILLGVGIVAAFGGMSGNDIEIIGHIENAFPHIGIPDFSILWKSNNSIRFSYLSFEALIIALVAFLETLSISKIMAAKTRSRIDANRELMSLGIANLGSSFFQCFPSCGSFSKTSTSYFAGTKSQLASLMAVSLGFVTLSFFTHHLAKIPRASLAAIVIVAVSHLIDIPATIRALRVKKSDGFIISFSFFATLVWGIEIGILLGLMSSFVIILWQTSHLHITLLGRKIGSEANFKELDTFSHTIEKRKDLLIIKVAGPLYFLSANEFETNMINLLADHHEIKIVILDGSAITDLDISGQDILWGILRNMMMREIRFILAGVTKPVKEVMYRSGFYEFLEEINYYPNLADAVAALDKKNEEK